MLIPSTGLAAPLQSSPAGNGAAGLTGTDGTGSNPQVKPANLTVSASVDGITIATSESALLHHQLVFSGSVAGATAADAVEIERIGPGTDGRWVLTTSSPVTAIGTFSATWDARQSGRFSIRALLIRDSASTTGSSAPSISPTSTAPSLTWPTLTITVYRIGIASIYGPGLYGHKTACGDTLRRNTLGVANVKLRCGTRVDLDFKGRSIVVPVIDRGPYVKGVEWDLTEATARALGMRETEAIGATSLSSP